MTATAPLCFSGKNALRDTSNRVTLSGLCQGRHVHDVASGPGRHSVGVLTSRLPPTCTSGAMGEPGPRPVLGASVGRTGVVRPLWRPPACDFRVRQREATGPNSRRFCRAERRWWGRASVPGSG